MLNVDKLPGLKWFLWIPLLVLLDQISKWFILHHLSFREIISIIPGIQLTLAQNRGIAFSLLSTHQTFGQIALILLIILICLGIAVWLAKTSPSDKWSGIALTLILGGALGNLFDRLVHGYVIDFIDIYYHTWHWYTFNLADSFITLGALMSVKTLFWSKEES